MERIRRTFTSLALAAGLALTAGVGSADAQVYVGPQLNVASETDLGVGGRLLADIDGTNLEFVGSADLYFPEGVTDYWELNGNLFYHFHLPETPSVLPYLGGGLNVANFSNGATETEAGVNLGGGLRFPLADVSPYVEARTVVGDFDQSVLSIGFVVGHAHGH